MIIPGALGPGGLMVVPQGGGSGAAVPMHLAGDRVTLGRERPREELVLTGEEEGLRIRETLTISAESYAVEAKFRIENASGAPQTITITLPWMTRQWWGEEPEKFTGQHPTEIVWATKGGVERMEDLCAGHQLSTDGEWIATGSVWYLVALIPKTPGFKLVATGEEKACERKGKEPAGRATIAVQASPTIPPGQTWEGHVVIYVGPKEYERLRDWGLQSTINFGGFPVPRKWGGLPMDWLGVPLLLLMKWVYRYVGNYGIVIILLTVITKILFYPLTLKSMASMKAMQALQPQVGALRAKYQKDPQRLQRETMELYRKHKVNPMGGCLPMFAQVPIFYALYLALSVSVELQNAAFLCIGRAPRWVPFLGGEDLWICNLAQQDPTYVLPVLMGISMFIQQKMSPTTGDPRQAKIMLVMPVVFTFMFLNLPSGLVLYWFVSNVLQILQQYYMDRGARSTKVSGKEAKEAQRV